MFRNIFRMTLRTIRTHKGYAAINVAGLAIGMACALLIMLWVMDELSYDRFHAALDSVYRIEQDQNYSGEIFHVTVTPYPMGPGVKSEIPEIRESVRGSSPGTLLLRSGETVFFESGGISVDPSFLEVLSFPLTKGDRATALADPHSIVLSEALAKKYFGREDPLGRTLTVNTSIPFTVTGVLKKIPDNSSVRFDFLVPFEFMREIGRWSDGWGNNSILTFVQLHDGASVAAVNEKITEARHRHVAEGIQDPERLRRFNESPRTRFMLKPLADVHLRSYFGYGKRPGDIQYVYIFAVIGLFVLLIAAINFMNLATARSARRAKEVGLRKVVGAGKRSLVAQFYGESVLITFAALAVALGLAILLLPRFNALAGKQIAVGAMFSPAFLAGMLGITLLTGLLSGSYPALFLSSFQPGAVLKGTLRTGGRSSLFRKVLVVAQFTLSILLVVGTTVVYRQVEYMRSKNLGYDKEHVIYLPLRGETPNFYEALRTRLRTEPGVVNVSGTNHPPTVIGSNSGGADWDGRDPEFTALIGFNSVDYDYIETMKIEMREGRTFSREFPTDPQSAFLVNEEVVKVMGVESGVGKRFSFQGVNGTIVGVVKNFHYSSLRFDIEPLALLVNPAQVRYVVIRLQPGDVPGHIDRVRAVWESAVPGYPFDYSFLDADFDRMYRTESRMGALLRTFTVIALIIAGLGLFGLSSFMAEQRTKEIGVRKVLGASVGGVVVLLGREFTKWVAAANLLAWPAAYLIMKNWLSGFAYRTTLGWEVFAGAGGAALLVALLTVSGQSIRAALANPADSLRYE